MFCQLKTNTAIYQWFVLTSACLTMFLRALFTIGTLPVLSNYYERRFDDRTLASMIGSIQIASSYVLALPTLWLSKKIGAGWTQILGGLFPCVGLVGTAFSTEAWHALIFNGIITGFGSMCMLTSCYTIMPMYFTKKDQIAPYLTMTVAMGLGALLTAKTINLMTRALGFKYFLCVSGLVLLLNGAIGLFYQAPEKETDNSDINMESSDKPKLTKRRSMIFASNRQGTFELANNEQNNVKDEVKANCEDVEESHMDNLEGELDETGVDFEDNVKTEQQDCEGKLKRAKMFLSKNKLIPVVIIAGSFGYSGHASYASIIADYSSFNLKFQQDDYDLAVTIQGVAQLVSGLMYIFLAQISTLSSVAAFSLGNLGQAVTAFSLLCRPSLIEFYILMGVNGVSISLMWNATYPVFVDTVGPKYATLFYMIACEVDGASIMLTSTLAAFLQVEIDINAGLYLAIGLLLCSVLVDLPATISTLCAPKVYTSNDEKVQITQFTAFRHNWDHPHL